MNATLKINSNPQNWIPCEGRAAWLERFGLQPKTAELSLTAPLSLWERAGATLWTDGTVTSTRVENALAEIAEEHFVRTGEILALLPEHLEHVAASFQDKKEKERLMRVKEQEMRADYDRQNAERRAREEREAEERKAANMRAEVDLLDAHGTVSQVERHAANVLPDAELLTLARDLIFAPLDKFPRFRRLASKDIEHGQECISEGDTDRETFGTDTDEIELSPEEFERLKEIKAAAEQIDLSKLTSKTATVEIRRHYAQCDEDTCPTRTDRYGILVTVEWAGRDLSREYAAEGEVLP